MKKEQVNNEKEMIKVPVNQKYTCKIVSVTKSADYSRRLFIQTDKEGLQFDQNGTPCKSNSFGLQYGNLINMIASKCPMASIMDATCNRQPNIMLINCLLSGATISVERVFKAAGEPREIEGVYENDTVVTKITDIKLNMSPMMQNMFMSGLQRASEEQSSVSSLNGLSML